LISSGDRLNQSSQPGIVLSAVEPSSDQVNINNHDGEEHHNEVRSDDGGAEDGHHPRTSWNGILAIIIRMATTTLRISILPPRLC